MTPNSKKAISKENLHSKIEQLKEKFKRNPRPHPEALGRQAQTDPGAIADPDASIAEERPL